MVAGVAVAGTAGLTACGSSAGDAVVQRARSGAASAASDAIAKADIPVGGGKVFDALKVVVTQPTAGDFKAFSAICTHQGCTVNGVSNGVITCPCHGSTFDIATGAVDAGARDARRCPPRASRWARTASRSPDGARAVVGLRGG